MRQIAYVRVQQSSSLTKELPSTIGLKGEENTIRRRSVYLFVAFVFLASTFFVQPVPAHAQDWRDLSADVDGDRSSLL